MAAQWQGKIITSAEAALSHHHLYSCLLVDLSQLLAGDVLDNMIQVPWWGKNINNINTLTVQSSENHGTAQRLNWVKRLLV